MAYLLDTHVILWALDEENRLSATAKNIITNINVACFVSIISFFEIAIKKKIRKLELTKSINEYITEIERIGIILLPIKKSIWIAMTRFHSFPIIVIPLTDSF